jgi:diguanylate cyclase (GGDEF)-like protein
MTRCVRTTDLVARIGGEEFTILLPETPLQGALMVAEELRAAIEAMHVDTAAGVIRVSASLGIADYCAGIEDLTTLVRIADNALYAAKAHGRNRVEVGMLPESGQYTEYDV